MEDNEPIMASEPAVMKQTRYMKNGYRVTIAMLLAFVLACGQVAAQSNPGVRIGGSVYGGGNLASVNGNTQVNVDGGTIGTEGQGGALYGNVYGGGKGNDSDVSLGLVKGNTAITVSGGTIKHNVYGGGAYGSVGTYNYADAANPTVAVGTILGYVSGGKTEIDITGGTIGYSGKDNGMVFGSSRGDVDAPGAIQDRLAWVYETHVTIGTSGQGTSTPLIKGSVYGSGENGHVFQDTEVIIHGGKIGIDDSDDPDGGAAYLYRGNVYGGGCGTDKYYSSGTAPTGHSLNDGGGDAYNPLAGIVYGNTSVTIDGGLVVHNVYGAGAMGSVGKVVSTTDNGVTTTTTTGGSTTINISGGIIGASGTVGDGNVFGAARGDLSATDVDHALVRLANVRETHVTIGTPGQGTTTTSPLIKGSVYGGGEVGSVGTYTVSDDMKNYTFESGTGACSVTINGGTIGTHVASVDGTFANGNVYGAGKGLANTFWCEKGMVYSTTVAINAGTVYGTVYGGGEVGRVENDATVTIGKENESGGGTTFAPNITGNVFGAGAGLATHGYSALLRGNTDVTVQGIAKVEGNVYGGGEKASVGKFNVRNSLPKEPLSGGTCKVNIKGYAVIGTDGDSNSGDVFGACKGVDPDFAHNAGHVVSSGETVSFSGMTEYLSFLKTLALTSNTEVTVGENAIVSGSVYGGGKRGLALGMVEVNMMGGTVHHDVYGGGALADTNTSHWNADNEERVEYVKVYGLTAGESPVKGYYTKNGDEYTLITSETTAGDGDYYAHYSTTVNLHGGTVAGNVYGGGLGDTDTPAKVYGDVTVHLNENTATDNCVVKNYIFGCNNVNGTPKGNVTVHIFKTQGWTDDNGTPHNDADDISHDVTAQKYSNADRTGTIYELAAVYGGGNNAAYVPANTYLESTDTYNTAGPTATNVIIEGCNLTSIEYVYGGGNAAAASGTYVLVNSCYEIGTLFAGGNGAGDGNPGAHVGYIANGGALTPYGSGVALAELKGGTIHHAFGGSNTLGNVRTSATVALDEATDTDGKPLCDLRVEEVYGAGNQADQDGTSNIDLGCLAYLGEIYGGAKMADVNSDIVLTIRSGRFDRVFGGNNLGGTIRGTVTVNIEETGCHPIVIGQLYGGGNQAAYSVENIPTARRVTDATKEDYYKNYPKVNVKSFTSIGEIYGGGYGATAVVTGNPHVCINECVGENSTAEMKKETVTNPDTGETTEVVTDVSENTGLWIRFVAGKDKNNADIIETVWQPEHKSGAIGTIGNVYGGGNAADVDGSTFVKVGQLSTVKYVSWPDDPTTNNVDESARPVVGANITGNVYGGGNAAVVKGNTNVQIGKE